MIKKLIYILILIILSTNITFAETENAYLEYNGYKYSFKPGDEVKFLKNANQNFESIKKADTDAGKAFYLQEALRYYFLLSQVQPLSIEAQVGLGRVYDEMKQDALAQKHFFVSLDLDGKSPRANYYLGDYYYKRNDLIPALTYFNNAFANGLSNFYDLSFKMGTIYEKLADIETAKKYYKNALRIENKKAEELLKKNSVQKGKKVSTKKRAEVSIVNTAQNEAEDSNLANKIRLLEELNYSESQYYLFNGTGKRKKLDNE